MNDVLRIRLFAPLALVAFVAPTNAVGAQGLPLNPPLATGRYVVGHGVSPDGAHAVYRANQEQTGVFELFRVALRGRPDPVKLSPTMPAGVDVSPFFRFAPDSTRLVYMTQNHTLPSVNQIYSLPLGGGAAVRLNGNLVSGGTVEIFFTVSSDSARLVYRAKQDSSIRSELYSVLLDGSAPAVKLNGTMPAGGQVRSFDPLLSTDGQRVVYVADQNTAGVYEVFSVPIDRSSPPVRLNAPLVTGGNVVAYAYGFAISPDSTTLVYLADQDNHNVIELYRAPLDGSAPSVRLNTPLGVGGDVYQFQISADSSRVVFTATTDANQPGELYSVPLAGGTAPTLLTPGLVAGQSAFLVAIGPDSSRVLYTGNLDQLGVQELYACAIDGSAMPVKLSGQMTPGGNVLSAALAPGGARVVYRADEKTDELVELFGAPFDGSSPALRLYPALFPDGNVWAPLTFSAQTGRVVFRAYTGQRVDVQSVPLAGGEVRRVASTTQGLSLTPDGRQIVYEDLLVNGASQVYVAPLVRPRGSQ